MKRCIFFIVLFFFVFIVFNPFNSYSQTVYSEETHERVSNKRGENIIFDLFVLRPLGVASCIIGVASTIASLPFALTSESSDIVAEEFIIKPVKHTFQRKLDDIDPSH